MGSLQLLFFSNCLTWGLAVGVSFSATGWSWLLTSLLLIPSSFGWWGLLSSNGHWSSLILRLALNHNYACKSVIFKYSVASHLVLGPWNLVVQGTLKADVYIHAIVENPDQLQSLWMIASYACTSTTQNCTILVTNITKNLYWLPEFYSWLPAGTYLVTMKRNLIVNFGQSDCVQLMLYLA